MDFTERLRRIASARAFEATVLSVILLASVLVGVQTYPQAMSGYGDLIHAVDHVIVVVPTSGREQVPSRWAQ